MKKKEEKTSHALTPFLNPNSKKNCGVMVIVVVIVVVAVCPLL